MFFAPNKAWGMSSDVYWPARRTTILPPSCFDCASAMPQYYQGNVATAESSRAFGACAGALIFLPVLDLMHGPGIVYGHSQ